MIPTDTQAANRYTNQRALVAENSQILIPQQRAPRHFLFVNTSCANESGEEDHRELIFPLTKKEENIFPLQNEKKKTLPF